MLHGPDQYPGGNPQQFTGLGDANVNGAYGWGWQRDGQRTELVDAMADSLEEFGIPADLLGDIRINVKIKVPVVR